VIHDPVGDLDPIIPKSSWTERLSNGYIKIQFTDDKSGKVNNISLRIQCTKAMKKEMIAKGVIESEESHMLKMTQFAMMQHETNRFITSVRDAANVVEICAYINIFSHVFDKGDNILTRVAIFGCDTYGRAAIESAMRQADREYAHTLYRTFRSDRRSEGHTNCFTYHKFHSYTLNMWYTKELNCGGIKFFTSNAGLITIPTRQPDNTFIPEPIMKLFRQHEDYDRVLRGVIDYKKSNIVLFDEGTTRLVGMEFLTWAWYNKYRNEHIKVTD
jgi:hypothetical protein